MKVIAPVNLGQKQANHQHDVLVSLAIARVEFQSQLSKLSL
jgi:hypothetical protein